MQKDRLTKEIDSISWQALVGGVLCFVTWTLLNYIGILGVMHMGKEAEKYCEKWINSGVIQ